MKKSGVEKNFNSLIQIVFENSRERRRELIGDIRTVILPMTLQNLISAIVNTADVIMLGYLNQSVLSASSLANQITMIFILFCSGLSSGIIIMASQYWGKRQTGTLRILLGMGLKVSLIVSAFFALCAIFIPKYLMIIYTDDPELIRIGASYLRVVGWSYLFMGISQTYECIIKSMGRAKTATMFSFCALIINILLNAVLIFGLLGFPALGITGAAIATVISRAVEAVLCILDSSKQPELLINLKIFALWNHTLFTDFCKYSLPALGNEFLWGAGFSCYTAILGRMGSDIVAANSVVSAARNLCMVFVFGAAYGAAVIIGNDIGSGLEKKARKDASSMLKIVFCASLLAGAVLLLIRPLIFHFTSLTDTAKYDLTVMLWINCIYILGMGLNTTCVCGLFRAGGDSRYGFILDTTAMWALFVPAAFLCAFVFHLPALIVYTLTCSDEFFKLPINAAHYLKGKWIHNITREEADLL